jgi:hypothetical protein
MFRTGRLALGCVALAALLAACSSGSSGDESTAGTLTARGQGHTIAPISTPSAGAAPTPLTVNASGLLKGNAKPDFPAGQAGKISVVAIGPLQKNLGSGTLPVAFRNNTARSIAHVDLTSTARLSSGKVVGTGSSQDVVPAQVQPGGVGLAYIYFEAAKAIPKAHVRYTFAADSSPADASSYNTAPVKITQANLVGGAIQGVGVNETGHEISGPYSVDAFCFTPSGDLASVQTDFANEDGNIPPGGTISYSLDLYGTKCPRFLVGSSGFFV